MRSVSPAKKLVSRFYPLLIATLALGATPVMAERDTATTRINEIIQNLEPQSSRGERATRIDVPPVSRLRHGHESYETYYAHLDRSMSFGINFAAGSAVVLRSQRPTLDELGSALSSRNLSGQKFLIIGHTDAAGDRAQNQDLSKARALAVRRYLLEHYDIAPDRLVALGFGEERLLVPHHPYSWRNRRVEVVLLDTGGARTPATSLHLPRFEAPRAEPARYPRGW